MRWLLKFFNCTYSTVRCWLQPWQNQAIRKWNVYEEAGFVSSAPVGVRR